MLSITTIIIIMMLDIITMISEFRDGVFEDVVFDNNRFYPILYIYVT